MNQIKQFLIFTLSILTLSSCFDYGEVAVTTVEGQVTDARTGDPVPNAELQMAEGKASSYKGTLFSAYKTYQADENGRFDITFTEAENKNYFLYVKPGDHYFQTAHEPEILTEGKSNTIELIVNPYCEQQVLFSPRGIVTEEFDAIEIEWKLLRYDPFGDPTSSALAHINNKYGQEFEAFRGNKMIRDVSKDTILTLNTVFGLAHEITVSYYNKGEHVVGSVDIVIPKCDDRQLTLTF